MKNLNSGWTIEELCPQCGAPITLQEQDHIFSCNFCKVRLYIISSGFLRYYIPPPKELNEDIIYAPYWRFKGISFNYLKQGLKHRIMDTSLLATGHDLLPTSLGFRTQTQKLKFLSPELKGKFLKQKIPFNHIFSKIEQTKAGLSKKKESSSVFEQTFIGETTSLIYAPFYLKNYKFYDAVLNSPVSEKSKINMPKSVPLETIKRFNRSFLSTLCPHCGWDLYGEKESCILICRNCNSVWKASSSGFKKVKFEIFLIPKDNIIYVPFWKIQTNIADLNLQKYADLARIANIPKAANNNRDKEKLYFWAPAFKVAPNLFLRLSKQLTISPLMGKTTNEPEISEKYFFPATLPSTEAIESIKVTLSQIVIDKKKICPILPNIKIAVQKYILCYLPFTIRANEIIQYNMRFSINKNSLKIGKNI